MTENNYENLSIKFSIVTESAKRDEWYQVLQSVSGGQGVIVYDDFVVQSKLGPGKSPKVAAQLLLGSSRDTYATLLSRDPTASASFYVSVDDDGESIEVSITHHAQEESEYSAFYKYKSDGLSMGASVAVENSLEGLLTAIEDFLKRNR